MLTWLLTNRWLLRAIWLPWIMLPLPVRKRATTAGIWALRSLKRPVGDLRPRERQAPTPPKKLFTLSFWGVPRISPERYALMIDGMVDSPLNLSLDALRNYPVVDRQVTLDCVGGLQNVITARGVPLATLLERAEAAPEADTAIFHCADGYFTTHPLTDLIETEAYLAYEINGQEIPAHGFPLRLVAPGKYGYKWAKWVVRIELAAGSPMGYWEQRGLPDRAWVGDLR